MDFDEGNGGTDLEDLLEKHENIIAPENENAITNDNERIISINNLPPDIETKIKPTFSKSNLGFAPADQELPDSGTLYEISPIAIFQEDNLQEFKEKIYVATGVPVQRQHIFWIDDTGHARTTYKMKTQDGGELHVDARSLLGTPKDKEDRIFGVKIDRYLYENWEETSVIAMDTFKTVGDAIVGVSTVIFIIDLADVLYNSSMLVSLANDKPKRDLLFYSAIYKYWPWFPNSEDMLNDFSISSIYPLLAPKRSDLVAKFQTESSILLNIPNEKRIVETSITMAIVSVSTGARINIRNLFDKIETNKDVPHVNAFIQDGALKYNLVKHHVGTPFVQFPNQTRSGLTIAVPLTYSTTIEFQNIMESQTGSKRANLFLNIQSNGIYYVLAHFGDEERVDFAMLVKLLMIIINPVIEQINSYADYIFMGSIKQLDPISHINARYPDINVTLTWKRQTSEGDFKILKNMWTPYEAAGIVNIKPITFGTNQNVIMELNFFKGCVEYDINQIARSSVLASIKNYYSHLTNPTVNHVWNYMYHGRTIHMVQRTSDIQFELFNMTQDNFIRFKKYLMGFLTTTIDSGLLSKRVVKNSNVKKLKALQEADPELYDLRKHGSKRLYTVICQEPRQPLVYLKREDAPKKATKYINMTTNESIYYHCDSKVHPVLSFIAGVHPLGYCLPCCKKRPSPINSDKYNEDKLCEETGHAKIRDVVDLGKLSTDASHHIMTYGKDVPKYRLGYAPKDIIEYLASVDVVGYKNIYMYGVGQNYPGIVGGGVLDALAFTVNMLPVKLAETFIKHINLMGIGYESLLNGEIIEWFESVESLTGTIHQLFISHDHTIIHFNRWLDLFAELYRLIKNNEVIIFNDGFIEYGGSAKSMAAILVKNGDLIYPLVRVDLADYYKTNIVHHKLFENVDKLMGPVVLRAASTSQSSILNDLMLKGIDLKLCVTAQRIAYGVISDSVFITFKPIYIPGNIKTTSEIPTPRDYKKSLKLLESVKGKSSEIVTGANTITLMDEGVPIAIAHCEMPATEQNKQNKQSIWKDIISMTPAKDRYDEILPKAISKHNLYNLLILQFTSYADKHKNTNLRNLIKSLIMKLHINDSDSLHEFTGTLKRKIENPNDIGVINTIVSQNINSKSKIIEIFDRRKFNFDKNNYYDMAKMSVDALKIEINEFVKNHIEIVDELPPPPKNLTLPAKKLKLPKDGLDGMIDLLIADLQNPLKLELMKSGALSSYLLLDLFDFERRPNENIKIIQS
jgi:hypothetical protein